MKQFSRLALLAGVVLAPACEDTSGPNTQQSYAPLNAATQGTTGASTITVYTQNLYVGADVDAIVEAPDQQQALAALIQAAGTLQRTSFATRAAAIADEIARTKPDVVGFQEGSKIDVDLTPIGLPLSAHEDFLATIKSALSARGLTNYVVADTVTDVQANLGVASLIDYDIMLVNADRVTLRSVVKRNFANNDGLFGGVNLIRGFVEARITVGGRDYVVVTTHAEGTDLTAAGVDYHQLHVKQMQEIVDEVNKVDEPAIVMGDLNDEDTSPMYQVMLNAGFADDWRTLRPGVDGNTCCHLSDLSDPRPQLGRFHQRIDFVFARGVGHANRDVTGRIVEYGLLPSDRLAGPEGTIWPSDHAGLLATLVRVPAGGVTP